MAAGAEFWVTYHVTDSNGVSYTPYSEDFSSSLSDTPKTAEFSETSVTFYNYRNEEIAYLSFDNPYNYNGVDYPISAIHCDGTDAQNNNFNVSGGCQIFVYYGKDPETGGGDVGGPDQGGNNPGEDSGDNDSSAEIPISFSFTVKSYKSGTLTEVADDFVVEKCYYVYRHDEGTIGEYGKVYLTYYTEYEDTDNGYRYTGDQTHEVPSSITGYKLSGFHGLENGESKTGEKDGTNNYPFEAYYIDNDFTVNIDAKGIDKSQVIVQNPNNTSIKYELPYTGNYPNTSLLFEALTSDDNYIFDYWEVNGEKYSTNSILDYEITQDTTIYCCFKEKPLTVEGKIATNEDIYNASKYIYGANNNQCPTKEFILKNGYDSIKFNNEYQDNQCVVLEDLSFERVFDNITLTNSCRADLDAFGIYFSYDKPVDSNKYDFLYYEFSDKEIKNGKTITLSKQTKNLSNLGDYRGKNLYVGFYSDGWGANRKFTFKIGDVSYVIEQDKSGYVGQSTSGYKIPVIDFLRYYYNKITIVIDKK